MFVSECDHPVILKKEIESECEQERESVCVCVCVCVRARVCRVRVAQRDTMYLRYSICWNAPLEMNIGKVWLQAPSFERIVRVPTRPKSWSEQTLLLNRDRNATTKENVNHPTAPQTPMLVQTQPKRDPLTWTNTKQNCNQNESHTHNRINHKGTTLPELEKQH